MAATIGRGCRGVNGISLAPVLLPIMEDSKKYAEDFMSRKRSKTDNFSASGPSTEERDELRMSRSGAAESGYHSPTKEDIDDLKKDHRTASEPGLVNADEEVRRDGRDNPGPIDSLTGDLRDWPEGDEDRRSA